MNTKKITTIIFVVLFISIGVWILLSNYNNIVGDNVIGQINSEESDDSNLNVPIEEEEDLKGDSTENVGAREDKYIEYHELEISNLEILEDYIKSENNVLAEIYAGAYSQVQELLKVDTEAVIDESSISYNVPIVTFTLLEIGSKEKIADISVELYDETPKEDANFEFVVQNLSEIKNHVKLIGDQLIYVREVIKEEIAKEFPKTKSCIIDTDSIREDSNILYFDVLDAESKNILKSIKINL